MMTMVMTERTREIGGMKAIGADPKLIQGLFLMEIKYGRDYGCKVLG